MNITIDIGNSSCKIALFENDRREGRCGLDTQLDTQSPRWVWHFDELTEKNLADALDGLDVEAGILCSVKKDGALPAKGLSKRLKYFFTLTPQLPLPLAIDYQTPQTLGMDRVAAAVGAWAQHPNANLLVIDIGTAITIDFVTSAGVYKGGNISPGPDLRFKALHTCTDKLPLVDTEGALPAFGYDTATAIRAGVVGGIVRELDAYIDEQQKNASVVTFLTGGSSFYFEDKLKNRPFADEHLVPKGLNAILNFQK